LETIVKIKAKAHDLYCKFGLRSVTMDDIAQGIGISKKTIYTFFEDKDALVDAIIVDEIAMNEAQCEADKKNATNALHEIFLALKMMQKTMADMNPMLLFELKKYYLKTFQKFEVFKDQFLYNIIKTNLERGIKEELYRNNINIEIITKMRLETMMMMFTTDFFTKYNYDLLYIEEQLLEHFLLGIASPKGHKLILKYQQERLKHENK
jgi:TetR/AcrR family transcriptional regulator, cholesterol catabolism regulator